MMVGRTIDDVFPKDFVQPGQPVLRVSKLCNRKLKDVDLIVREGEIVGLAWLVQEGQSLRKQSLGLSLLTVDLLR